MKLYIEGELNEYYAQTLCLLFFPGAKFSLEETLTDTSDVVRIKTTESEQGVTAYAEMRSGNKTASATRFEPYKPGITKVRAAKIVS